MSITDVSANVENYNINNYRIDHIKFILDISVLASSQNGYAYIPCTAIDGYPQFSGMIGMGKNFVSFGLSNTNQV